LAHRQCAGEAAALHGTEKDMNQRAMTRHVAETDLALYAAGDLPFWQNTFVRLHVRQCDECRGFVEALRADREELRRSAGDLPANVDWDQLASEMTANIRVGL